MRWQGTRMNSLGPVKHSHPRLNTVPGPLNHAHLSQLSSPPSEESFRSKVGHESQHTSRAPAPCALQLSFPPLASQHTAGGQPEKGLLTVPATFTIDAIAAHPGLAQAMSFRDELPSHSGIGRERKGGSACRHSVSITVGS